MPTELCARRSPAVRHKHSRAKEVGLGLVLASWGLAMVVISLLTGPVPQ
jgi:hypothetical protein